MGDARRVESHDERSATFDYGRATEMMIAATTPRPVDDRNHARRRSPTHTAREKAPLPPSIESEARATLIASAERQFGSIPPDLLVDLVMGLSSGGDFAVIEAAVQALTRRWGFARRDELEIASRPARGAVAGTYTTTRASSKPQSRKRKRRRAGEPRPYTTVIHGLRPIVASCDCPDFVRSSLGVCKHALVVLEEIFADEKRLARATREAAATTAGPTLSWCPSLPLAGDLDRLAGLRFDVRAARDFPLSIRRSLDGDRLRAAVLHDPIQRGACLRALTVASGRLDVSPSARAVVADELERAERSLRFEKAAKRALPRLDSLQRQLYPYQREGVERFLRAGRLLLADDMGLGKTTQAIAACHALFHAGVVERGIIVVPASLKSQWLREWRETTATPATIVEGNPDERARHYRELRAGFLVIGYEQLLRDAAHVHRCAPQIVVLDEAQRIKNYATKSAAYVKALSPDYRLVLTGTPMENRLEELASVLDWVDDVALSPKWRLVSAYTRSEGDGASGVAGARNLDTLRARLSRCLVRRVRKEVIAQLPARTDTRVPIEMTPQQIAEHEELTAPIARLLQTGKRRPLRQPEFLRLMQLLAQQRIIANGLGQQRFDEIWPAYRNARPDAALLEGLFSPKLVELRRIVGDLVLAQGRKVVVFSQWRRMLRLAEWSLRDLLGDRGLRSCFFTGAERPSQRTQSVVDFHDDPRVAVMFLSDAGGVGLNLQRAASACINLEMPWNPAVLEQRIGRIYRLGQTQPIDVFNLVSEGSIEARIAGLVRTKQALFAGLFDGTSDELRFDTAASFLTNIERIVERSVPDASTVAMTTDGDETETDVEESPKATSTEAATVDTALADDLTPEVAGAASTVLTPNAASVHPIAGLLGQVRMERTPAGSIRIEAPPEAAASLLALFDGLAKMLASSAPS